MEISTRSDSELPTKPNDNSVLIVIVLCSIAGTALLFLSAILVVLVVIKWKRGRNRIREYSVERPNHKERKESKETVHIEGQTLLLANHAPNHFQPQATNVQQLQTVSPLILAPSPTSGRIEADTGTNSAVYYNCLTVEVDVEDSGTITDDVGFVGKGNRTRLPQFSERCTPPHDYENTVPKMKLTVYEKCNPPTDSHKMCVNTTSVVGDTIDADENGYVNVPFHSHSLSQSLLTGQEHCGPAHLNYTRQISVPVRSNNNIPNATMEGGRTCASTHHSLPPRTNKVSVPTHSAQPATIELCETKSPTDESGYINIISTQSSHSPLLSPRPLPTAVVSSTTIECTGHDTESAVNDPRYVNVIQQVSLSQPSLPTLGLANSSSIIPPRTIPRRNFPQPTCDTSTGTLPLPPRLTTIRQPFTQKGAHHQNSTHKNTPLHSHTSKDPPFTVCTLSPLDAGMPIISSEVDTKSTPRRCSDNQPDLDNGAQTDKDNSYSTPAVKDLTSFSDTSMPESGVCSDFSDAQRNQEFGTETKLAALDGGMSESVESLDIWPPVIPRHSDLKFIVRHHDSTDHYSDSIEMITNESYVNMN